MTGLQSWYVVLVHSQVNVRGPCKCASLSTWKKQLVLFLLALSQTVANLWFTFLLKQTRLSAAQSPSSFIYMHFLTLEQRSSQIMYKETCPESSFLWAQSCAFEVFLSKYREWSPSKLPHSCNDFSQNKNPLFKKKKNIYNKTPIPNNTIFFWRLKTCSLEIDNLTGTPSDIPSDKAQQGPWQIPA